MKEVVVTVEGGVVQDIEVPEGVVVKVRDYDVEGVDSADIILSRDKNGDGYVESTWENINNGN